MIKDLDNTKSAIDNWNLRILFIGRFNAGKSALINCLLERDLLKEAQKPETTIATEIRYGTPERVVLFDENNKPIVTTTPDEVANYNPNDYFNYVYYIENDVVAELKDYVVVDMPGYDSGVEKHNKAITQYIGKGTAFILVVDADNGTLHRTDKEFMKEINLYKNGLIILLNKCEKVSDYETTKLNIEKDTVNIFDTLVPVITTSKHFEDTSITIKNAINSFNAQSLFDQSFNPAIIDLLQRCKVSLETIISSKDLDVSEIDNKIRSIENSDKVLKEKLEKERKKLKNELQNSVKNSILADIQNSLLMNSSKLAVSAKGGGESFSRAVNNCIRPVLISSTQKYTEKAYANLVDSIDFESMKSNMNQSLDDIAVTLANVSEKIKQTTNILTKIGQGTNNTAYKAVAGTLAAATAVVAPWLEVIIIFAPEIMKILGAIFGQNQDNIIREKIEFEIIPQIVNKLNPEIENSMSEIEQKMIEELETSYANLLEANNSGLNEAIRMKSSKKNDYDTFISETKKDLELTQSIINEIENGVTNG